MAAQAVEYGAEAVDPDIREDNIDVKYMDLQGVERRVGAKTRFDDVKRARLLRITRKPIDPFASPKNQEKLGLVGGYTKSRPAPKRCARSHVSSAQMHVDRVRTAHCPCTHHARLIDNAADLRRPPIS